MYLVYYQGLSRVACNPFQLEEKIRNEEELKAKKTQIKAKKMRKTTRETLNTLMNLIRFISIAIFLYHNIRATHAGNIQKQIPTHKKSYENKQ